MGSGQGTRSLIAVGVFCWAGGIRSPLSPLSPHLPEVHSQTSAPPRHNVASPLLRRGRSRHPRRFKQEMTGLRSHHLDYCPQNIETKAPPRRGSAGASGVSPEYLQSQFTRRIKPQGFRGAVRQPLPPPCPGERNN